MTVCHTTGGFFYFIGGNFMRQLIFEIPLDPVPLARPKFSHGRAYLPPRSRSYRAAVQDVVNQLMKSRNLEPFTGELICRLKFFRKFKPTTRNFGDIDNHVKAILDALQGLLFVDDRQIVSIAAQKLKDTDRPRTQISFTANKGDDYC